MIFIILLTVILDDETDMVGLEAAVRGIEKDGLVWGASKLVPVGFGIKKLQINLVIEDDKIGLDDLQEEIQEFEDYVQSSDIVSFSTRGVQGKHANYHLGCHAKVVEHFSVPGLRSLQAFSGTIDVVCITLTAG
jgi:translation elongation factor EF-1beta